MDEDTQARLRWYRLILETLEMRGFAQAMGMFSVPDLKNCLKAAIEVEAWRAMMPQHEYRDGQIHRTLESLPPFDAALIEGADMDIVKLAAESAKAAEYYRLLGMQNTYGQSPEERVAASARYRMAQDAWMAAERAYRDAIAGLSADELSKIAAS